MLINKASREKTVVITPFGALQFNFMPFGFKMRVKLFNYQNFRDLDFVFVYLDNILISSGTEEEHGAHLWFGQEPVFL